MMWMAYTDPNMDMPRIWFFGGVAIVALCGMSLIMSRIYDYKQGKKGALGVIIGAAALLLGMLVYVILNHSKETIFVLFVYGFAAVVNFWKTKGYTKDDE